LAVVGHQVWLGEATERTLRAKEPQDAAEPLLLVKEEQVEEVREHQADALALLATFEVGRVELLEKNEKPASKSALRLISAKRTWSMTCSLTLPPGTCSMLMISLSADDAWTISPTRSMISVLEAFPDRMMASSL
jgi:hypothetical protein